MFFRASDMPVYCQIAKWNYVRFLQVVPKSKSGIRLSLDRKYQ